MPAPTERNDIRTLAEKIRGISVAMLTTLDPSGVLHSRPMATQEFDFDGQLWFFTKSASAKADSIRHDQHVNVSYSDPGSNRWVSVAGRACIVRDRAKIRELWSPMLKAWFEGDADDPEIALICVEVESAQYWDSPSGPLVILLGFAKQMITGRALEPDQGKKKIDLRH
ncbi:MAG: pyridoxamine 5'-phosphate oxidase family protein [Bdellovibrionota bacterium]